MEYIGFVLEIKMWIWLSVACVPELLSDWLLDRHHQSEDPRYASGSIAIEGVTYSETVRAEVSLRPVQPSVDERIDLEISVYANQDTQIDLPKVPDRIGGLAVLSRSGGGGGSDRHTVSTRVYELRAVSLGTYTISSVTVNYVRRTEETGAVTKVF